MTYFLPSDIKGIKNISYSNQGYTTAYRLKQLETNLKLPIYIDKIFNIVEYQENINSISIIIQFVDDDAEFFHKEGSPKAGKVYSVIYFISHAYKINFVELLSKNIRTFRINQLLA
jgi:hypothetical protein